MADGNARANVGEDLSGRRNFSVRLPERLYEELDSMARGQGVSMNWLIGQAVASLVGHPEFSPVSTTADIDSKIARDSVRQDPDQQPSPIGALKGIAKYLSNRGEIALACVLWAAAARLVNAQRNGGPEKASVELAHSAAVAEGANHQELAVALFEEALRLDPNNLEATNRLGQLLHHLAQQRGDDIERYREAEEQLARVAFLDDRAMLFHGWASFYIARSERDATGEKQATAEIQRALERWAFQNPNDQERVSWLRQVRRLADVGLRSQADELIDFASRNARWRKVEREEIAKQTQESVHQP
ncbi:MAG: ribbon-helix-helix protein, CopG family [Chloroflexota bacterium]